MAPKIIVSYDGTDNDRDALALGRVFAQAGAALALAYVCHGPEPEPGEEERAERMLADGAAELGAPDIRRHVVVSASTPQGLQTLAEQEGAEALAFGSDYRTAAGHVAPGTSADGLLEGGGVGVAIAPAGLRDRPQVEIHTIASVDEEGDSSARETATSLAQRLGASATDHAGDDVDLLVIGSRAGVAAGQVAITGTTRYLIETVACPVLVVPREDALLFDASS